MSQLWINKMVAPPAPIDTVIFDVDGVLWDTRDSFDIAVQQCVAYFLVHHYQHSSFQPVSKEELRAFRRAGGLNNDWDMTYTLLATRLIGQEDFEQLAVQSGGRGRSWAQSLLPPRYVIDYEQIVRVFDEIYWGARDFERYFGEPPRYVVDAPGCWQGEVQLHPHSLFDDLRRAGIQHFGIATGRSKFELATVLESSGIDQHIPAEAMLTGDVLTKPDGRVLARVLADLDQLADAATLPRTRSALFCGDTKDDLDAVLNYRRMSEAPLRWIGAVAVVEPDEQPFFQRSGSDAVIDHIAKLPSLVEAFNTRF